MKIIFQRKPREPNMIINKSRPLLRTPLCPLPPSYLYLFLALSFSLTFFFVFFVTLSNAGSRRHRNRWLQVPGGTIRSPPALYLCARQTRRYPQTCQPLQQQQQQQQPPTSPATTTTTSNNNNPRNAFAL